ncbi:uncharacterized protein TNCV_1711411 [Trichonephila clavipes]|nr:uncharacterized protein TNCV_1711411 [Trichonephila clavipes]
MITNFFIPELNNHDVQELWFQQDGATCHTARATIDLLKDTFGDRLISRFGPVNWPPRSCDLTPLDYFLWGYVKSLVYADKPQTLDHLEDNIRRVIADIRPQMLEKVIENWTTSEPAVAPNCEGWNRRSVRQLHRAAETPEKSQGRRHAEYLASQRAAETPEQSQARRLQHATYMASQRDTETFVAAESRKRSVAKRAQQRRQILTKNTWGVFDKAAFEYDETLDYESHKLIKIEEMNKECRFCGALKWPITFALPSQSSYTSVHLSTQNMGIIIPIIEIIIKNT